MTMHQPQHSRMRRWCVRLCVCAILLGALGLGLVRLFLPVLAIYPNRISSLLSSSLGTPVKIGSLQARWADEGPTITLHDVQIGQQQTLHLARAEAVFDPYAWAIPGRHTLANFRLQDVDVKAERDANGQWHFAGLSHDGSKTKQAFDLGALRSLQRFSLRNAMLHVNDLSTGMTLNLPMQSLRVEQLDGVLTIGVLVGAATSWKAYVKADAFVLSQWLEHRDTSFDVLAGSIDSQLWLQGKDTIESGQGTISASQVKLRGPPIKLRSGESVQPEIALQLLATSLSIRSGATAPFRLQLDNFRTQTDANSKPVNGGQVAVQWNAGSTIVQAAEMDLQAMARLATVFPLFGSRARRATYEYSPTGSIANLSLRHDRLTGAVLKLQTRGTSIISSRPKVPSVENFDLQLNADNQTVQFDLRGANSIVRWPLAFTNEIPVTRLSLQGIATTGYDAPWNVRLQEVEAIGKGFAASAQGVYTEESDRDGTLMDMTAHVQSVDMADANRFWLKHKMSAQLINWLNHSIKSGKLTDALFVARGTEKAFPYRGPEGSFAAEAALHDMALDYHQKWPAAKNLQTHLRFAGPSLQLSEMKGTLADVQINTATAYVDDLHKAVLHMNLQGAAPGPQWLSFLRATPLQEKHGDVMREMAFGGAIEAQAELELPLKDGLGESHYLGHATLQDVRYADSQFAVLFDKINGDLEFSERGFSAPNLRIQRNAEHATLSLQAGGYTADDSKNFVAEMTGVLSAQDVFDQRPALAGLLRYFDGTAPWTIHLVNQTVNQTNETVLRVDSSLRGINVNLPTPMGKSAETDNPLQLRARFVNEHNQPVQLQIGEQVRALIQVADSATPFSARLNFGDLWPKSTPASGLVVDGHLDHLDLTDWLAVFAGGTSLGQDGINLQGITVSTDDLRAVGRNLGPGTFDLQTNSNGWAATIDNQQLKGKLLVNTEKGNSSIDAQFERIRLPKQELAGSASRFVDAASLPSLHFYCKELSLGDANLGATRLETFPIKNGLKVDLFEAKSSDLELHASGEWTQQDKTQQSRFRLRFSAEDLGLMLKSLGYGAVVSGGQTLVEVDGGWDDAPINFELAKLNGKMHVWVGPGEFLELNPGAGRIFGLLSLRELPRRLALDFRDFFKNGMSFDRIEGDFDLRDGDAFTQSLKVKGATADMLLSGRAGLSAQDYDQRVLVSPKLGGALPVVGAIAGGPAGAAAGLFLQGMMDGGGANQIEYHIGGSWEKPIIEKISQQRGVDRAKRERKRKAA
jgi:uncharacterized protein (TIGR02099 family)